MTIRFALGCVLTGLLLASAGWAAEFDAVAFQSQAPGLDDYPEADVIILYEKTDYRIDTQGRVNKRVHQVRKLQTWWAARSLADLRVDWDSTRQELEVTTCRTLMRDGTIVDTPPNGFNEVTPDAVSRYTDFLSIREMVISHVGTETGCIVELEYEIRDLEPPVMPANGIEFLQGPYPVLMREVTISSEQRLAFTLVNGDHLPITTRDTESAGKRTVGWILQDIPGLPIENNAAHQGDYLPHIVFSTVNSMQGLATRLHQPLSRAAQPSERLQRWLEQTDNHADGSSAGDLTIQDTVQRIAELVGSRIRTVNPPHDPWQRAPRTATEVFRSSYGTPWEKGILAVTLLRELGLEPEFACFSRWTSSLTDVAALSCFAAVRVAVIVDNTTFWLAPERDAVAIGRCDLKQKTGLFLEKDGRRHRTYTIPAGDGAAALAVDIRPNPSGDGFLGTVDLTLAGTLYHDQQDCQEVADDLAEALLVDGKVTGIQEREITAGRLHLRCEITGSALAEDTDGAVVYDLPRIPGGVTASLPGSLHLGDRDRSTPLFVTSGGRERIELRLTVPAKMQLDYLPPDRDQTAGNGSFVQSSRWNGKQAIITRELRLVPGTIDPAVYPEFRAILASVRQPDAGVLVLVPE